MKRPTAFVLSAAVVGGGLALYAKAATAHTDAPPVATGEAGGFNWIPIVAFVALFLAGVAVTVILAVRRRPSWQGMVEQQPLDEPTAAVVSRWHCIVKVRTPTGWVEAKRAYFDWPATDPAEVEAVIEARARAARPDLTSRCWATPA